MQNNVKQEINLTGYQAINVAGEKFSAMGLGIMI